MTRVRFHEKAVANCPLISRVTCRMCDSGNPSEPASTRLLYPARVCLLWYTHTKYRPGEAPLSGINGTEAEVSKCNRVHSESPEVSIECGNRASFCFSRSGWPGRGTQSHHDGPRHREHASNGQRTGMQFLAVANISTLLPRGPSGSKHVQHAQHFPVTMHHE
jgi:hypothetical protein